jgi:tetratricopeptide (TPR) repeat protein/DNA-binding CsgD family transcriptional regulator
MTAEKLSQINNIIFTPREIDVIACIINVRGVKKIADILGISHRTVESYIKTILRKISSNSQEAIKDFVEKSSELVLLKQHYTDLLINKLFLSQIAKVAVKLKNKNILCFVSQTGNEKLEYIISCLKLANINITEQSVKIPNNDGNQKIITVLTEKHLLQLKQAKKIDNTIFVCFDKRLSDDFLQKFSYIQIVDCFEKDQIYSSIFKIIELLAPNIDLHESISSFNKQKNNVINLKIDLTTRLLDVDQEIKEKIPTTKKITIITFILIAIIGIVLSTSFLIYKNYYSSTNISVNFLLPNKKILLERKVIVDQLDKIFTKPNEINIAVLVGVGGSGKTTIARNYASRQKASIIWEINAETKKSLSLSLEGLAYALCDNSSDKQKLRDILDIKDFVKKDRQLLLFTQRQLRLKPDWFVIYDNAESFEDIVEYFPNNSQSWGNGRVIITTRDATIKNNSYIDNQNVINVDEINEKEKLELFKNITGDSSPQLVRNQETVEQFLKNIPSFPLDVSIAAHYLRDTGVEYNQYLKEIKTPKKEFTELQTSILQDVNEYTKTRYNIVSLTLQNIIKSNSEFYDLALLIGLLDSQEIPEELLVIYKNQYITSDFLRKLKKNSLITNIQYKDNDKKDIDNLTSFSIHRSTQVNILADIIDSLTAKQTQEVLSTIFINIQSYILKQIDLENSSGLKNFIRHCEVLSSKHDLLAKEDLILINNSLGIIYYYLGNDKQAKNILEENLNADREDQETALILTHLGAIYRKIGQDYQTAIDYLKKAIAIYNKISPDSVREGLALTHLGNTYRTLGDFQNAIETLQKSVNIYHKHSGYYAGEARALSYLGVAYRESGDLTEAKGLLEQAINLYNKESYPKYSSVYAGTLAHLAITYRMMEKYDKAKDILEESVEIYKQIRPENHPDIGRNILNLGIIYGEIKENIKAKELLEKSLNDYENNYGKSHIETGKVLNHLGRFYILAKNYKDAEISLKRAGDILQQNFHPESYRSFELLGDLHISNLEKQPLLNKEAAKSNYNKSLELAQKYFSGVSVNVNRVKDKIIALEINN